MKIHGFILFLLFSCICGEESLAQQPATKDLVMAAAFEDHLPAQTSRRGIMSTQNLKGIRKLNPLVYISAGLLYTYQNVFSQQIQADCTYEVSCSANMKHCIAQHGFVRGLLMGMDQWNACHPLVLQDYSDYKISSNNKIDNRDEY